MGMGRRPGWPTAIGLTAIISLAGAACGGGGGGSNVQPTPIPTIPIVTATPGPAATPTPTPAISRVETILRQGDAIPGGSTVQDIEDADVATSGAIAAIVQVAGARGGRAVVSRSPAGALTAIFSPEQATDFDASTIAQVRVAPGGQVLFEAGTGQDETGTGLDSDRLYLASGGTTQALAGAPPGVVAPDFRILGEVEIGQTGIAAFVGGGSPCTVTQQGDSVRVRCTAHLYVANGFTVEEVEVPDIDLGDQSISTPQIAIADSGEAFFSLPGSGEEPTIVRLGTDGKLHVVLTAADEVDPVGRIVRPQLNAVNAAGDLLVTTTIQEDATPRPAVIGILRGMELIEVARESGRTGPDDVTDVRTVGLDDAGRVLFTATLGNADAPDGPRRSLRLFDGTAVQEIATENATFTGTDLTVLEISSTRFNRHGDVAFVAQLGRRTSGTVIVEEERVVLRRADGTVSSPLSTNGGGSFAQLGDISITGFSEDASILVRAQAQPSGDRVLLRTLPPA
ncbi:MAG TPA: hypothetical protein VFD92_07190 [Candidatus Binatia bacterium]|nr:hypothetical protein [Candidatus Binatia bacterium]